MNPFNHMIQIHGYQIVNFVIITNENEMQNNGTVHDKKRKSKFCKNL